MSERIVPYDRPVCVACAVIHGDKVVVARLGDRAKPFETVDLRERYWTAPMALVHNTEGVNHRVDELQ